MSSDAQPFTALVLAGSRGPEDPVARFAGQPHKAFVAVDGVPMLLRVLRTLLASRWIERITLSLEDPTLAATVPEIAALVAEGRVTVLRSDSTPSRSVLSVLAAMEQPGPLLVTTADHPLLTTAMVDHFCTAAPREADVALALARGTLIRRAYPDAIRTFYRFSGEGYSGCNLFALRTPIAAKAVAFWSGMERHRKKPWRLISTIGPVTLARFLLGRLSLDAALRRLSDIAGAKIRAVDMPFAEAAIDVDKPADLALAETILRGRS
ncbi:nucleotidyltransferase family protein [Rhodospirillaceae bacterium SYSU D60014]|uniref:nucleotidyltransferase family protein n=1 Tax=Virgifigura deserti TaxID=2268457 RepID=UPI000E661E6B